MPHPLTGTCVLQCGLLEKFPEEAGSKDPAARIIPFLPGTYTLSLCAPGTRWSMDVHAGKKLLGRSQVRSVATKRRERLNDYCQVHDPEHVVYVF